MSRSRKSTTKRRKRGRSEGDFGKTALAIAGIAVFVLIIVGLFALQSKQNSELARINPETFCDRTYTPAILIVVVDTSDGLDSVQRERTRTLVLQAIEDLPERGRVDLYVLSDVGRDLATPVLQKCNPGANSSALTTDEVATRRRYQDGYIEVIEAALETSLSEPEAKTSHIAELIRSAGTKSLSRIEDRTPVNLIIISDMLQHSDAVSHYRAYDDVETLISSPRWANLLTDLHGASVTLGYVVRPVDARLQGRDHQEWWDDYFREINARVRRIETY